jgi:hypothetical protein
LPADRRRGKLQAIRDSRAASRFPAPLLKNPSRLEFDGDLSMSFNFSQLPVSLLIGAVLLLAARPARCDEEIAMFNGTDLTGWKVDHSAEYEVDGEKRPVWTVSDGEIHCAGKGFGFLRYEKKFADFEFSVEYNMTPGCNSGIGVRTVEFTGGAKTRPSYASYELQIVDDAGKPADVHSTMSLYRYVAPLASAAKKAGEWNKAVVRCVGPKIVITLNDVKVQDVDQSKIKKLRSKPLEGYICLQNHGHEVRFRNLKLTRIDAASTGDEKK